MWQAISKNEMPLVEMLTETLYNAVFRYQLTRSGWIFSSALDEASCLAKLLKWINKILIVRRIPVNRFGWELVSASHSQFWTNVVFSWNCVGYPEVSITCTAWRSLDSIWTIWWSNGASGKSLSQISNCLGERVGNALGRPGSIKHE